MWWKIFSIRFFAHNQTCLWTIYGWSILVLWWRTLFLWVWVSVISQWSSFVWGSLASHQHENLNHYLEIVWDKFELSCWFLRLEFHRSMGEPMLQLQWCVLLDPFRGIHSSTKLLSLTFYRYSVFVEFQVCWHLGMKDRWNEDSFWTLHPVPEWVYPWLFGWDRVGLFRTHQEREDRHLWFLPWYILWPTCRLLLSNWFLKVALEIDTTLLQRNQLADVFAF